VLDRFGAARSDARQQRVLGIVADGEPHRDAAGRAARRGDPESLLRNGGITTLRRYPSSIGGDALFEPSERKGVDQALDWARSQNMRYAVTGTVDEWRYKVGVDGEPAVGFTLQVLDVPTGRVLWSAAGGRTGWSREALSAVAHQLLTRLSAPLVAAAR
jgi:hypothetical protein